MLTPELRAILRYVHRYCREKGYSPSYKEIGQAVGLRSVAHVQYRVDKLESLGYVTRQPKMARSVRVVRLPGGPFVPDRVRRRLRAFWRTVRGKASQFWGRAKLLFRRAWKRLRAAFPA